MPFYVFMSISERGDGEDDKKTSLGEMLGDVEKIARRMLAFQRDCSFAAGSESGTPSAI